MRNLARSAVTLIEITVALAIFGVVATIAGQSLVSGTRMSEEISVSSNLNDETSRVLQRIAGQLRSADYSWIYVNKGEVATYTFRVCTGLGVDASGEIGPQFDQTYTIAFDSVTGVLTATLADQKTGRLLNQEIARDLRIPDGFRVNQLGTDVLVKGNQLQLAMARRGRLADGSEITREASTTIFLRSTLYANTNLTTTPSIVVTVQPAQPVAPVAVVPIVLLGDDTDATMKVLNKKAGLYANNLLIKGSVQFTSGQTGNLAYDSFDLRLSKPSDGVQAESKVTHGWIAAENRAGKLAANEFLIEGWVHGALTITATISSASGVEGTASKNY